MTPPMDQSNGDEVKALKESVSRLAISIKNADPEKREGLKSSWDSTVARLNFLGWSVVGPDPCDAAVSDDRVLPAGAARREARHLRPEGAEDRPKTKETSVATLNN